MPEIVPLNGTVCRTAPVGVLLFLHGVGLKSVVYSNKRYTINDTKQNKLETSRFAPVSSPVYLRKCKACEFGAGLILRDIPVIFEC